MKFGSFVNEARCKQNIDLEDFCNMIGYDPKIWRFIESNRVPMNLDYSKLENIANILRFRKDSMEYKVLGILAIEAYRSSVNMATERGAFPIYDSKREADNPMILRIKAADPALYKKMVAILVEDCPWIFGVHRLGFSLTQPWLKNFKYNDVDMTRSKYYRLDKGDGKSTEK